jgi:hypothetical protein
MANAPATPPRGDQSVSPSPFNALITPSLAGTNHPLRNPPVESAMFFSRDASDFPQTLCFPLASPSCRSSLTFPPCWVFLPARWNGRFGERGSIWHTRRQGGRGSGEVVERGRERSFFFLSTVKRRSVSQELGSDEGRECSSYAMLQRVSRWTQRLQQNTTGGKKEGTK